MIDLKETGKGVVLPVKARPGARRSEILGVHGGALKLAVAAAPEKGKANREIVALLSRELKVPKGSIELVRGAGGPEKAFRIVGAVAGRN